MAQQNPVYDPESDERQIPRTGQDVASHNATDPRDTSATSGTPKSGFSLSKKSTTPKDGGVSHSTKKPSFANKDDLAKSEESSGLFNSDGESGFSKNGWNFKKAFTKKRAAAGGGIIGTSVFLGVMFSSVAQGPMQLMHMSQLLQRFHMSSNEGFADGRTGKVLYYAMAGAAGNGRLSMLGNAVANRYEKTLIKQGIQPVYNKGRLGHSRGYVVDTKDKAEAIAKEHGGEVKIIDPDDSSHDFQGSKKNKKPQFNYFVDQGGLSAKKRHTSQTEMLKLTHNSRISATVGARLMKKRGGLLFHVLHRVADKADRSNNKWIMKILGKDAEDTRKGTVGASSKATPVEDENGNEVETEESKTVDEVDQTANDTKEAINNADLTKESVNDIYKKLILKGGGGATLIAGLICTAQDFGDNVSDYKYANISLPMMRMGWKAISTGDQIKSNDDFDPASLEAFTSRLYDKKAPAGQKSWINAKSIQGELGQKQTGPDLPEEARLGNVNDKPAFFDLVDKIPGMSAACDVQDAIAGLPIIKQVGDVASTIASGAADTALKPFGTSTQDLGARALAMVAGDTINPYAKGAEYGNYVNVGSFLAANDSAKTMGGVPLSNKDVALLKNEAHENIQKENSKKSFAYRYLNPYDRDSLVGTLIDNSPDVNNSTSSTLTNTATLLRSSFANLGSAFFPQIKAADKGFNYGVPKYGFSPSDRDNPDFDNPYKNAEEVENSGKLDDLNDKYGKTCFGISVNDNGFVETEEQGGSGLNIFKVAEEHPECDPKNNSDPWFLRYRFYLADATTLTSTSCFYGDEEACAILGFNAGAAESAGSEDPETTINMGELYESSVNINCAPGTKDLGIQDGYHDYKKVRIRVCAVSSVSETGDLSTVPGANGKLVVNSRVSAAFIKMFKDARKAGVSGISASEGFRTMERQQYLKDCGCTGGNPVAPPGTSNHQMGIAVDVSGAINSWMIKNGEKYGFKWYGSGDSVHFSPTGN